MNAGVESTSPFHGKSGGVRLGAAVAVASGAKGFRHPTANHPPELHCFAPFCTVLHRFVPQNFFFARPNRLWFKLTRPVTACDPQNRTFPNENGGGGQNSNVHYQPLANSIPERPF